MTPQAHEIIRRYFPVLDHGFIALVDVMGDDEAIEEAARVSYQGGTRATSSLRNLLRYLIRRRHTTPLEMVELKFHVCAPLFVARQWFRHRTGSFNEVSGRYSLQPQLFYTPAREDFALQATDNKQGRDALADERVYTEAVKAWELGRRQASDDYAWLAASGVARELARIDLPLSLYTQWYWKVDLHNLFHFLSLRADSHAQKEIRVYAEAIAGMVQRVAPVAYEGWLDYRVLGAEFSRMEMEVLRDLLHAGERSVFTKNGQLAYVELVEGYGFSKREVEEFRQKLQPRKVPDFSLDLAQARDGEYFLAQAQAATPTIDQQT